ADVDPMIWAVVENAIGILSRPILESLPLEISDQEQWICAIWLDALDEQAGVARYDWQHNIAGKFDGHDHRGGGSTAN
ncbi:MAG: hypothetical protein ALECFALPRED_000928, partial [Alectoria fallacina]